MGFSTADQTNPTPMIKGGPAAYQPDPTGGDPGTPNRGNGGGGAGWYNTCTKTGGTGGSGVVSIAVPQANFPTYAPGAIVTAAPPSYPGVTILTFTAPGTYTV